MTDSKPVEKTKPQEQGSSKVDQTLLEKVKRGNRVRPDHATKRLPSPKPNRSHRKP